MRASHARANDPVTIPPNRPPSQRFGEYVVSVGSERFTLTDGLFTMLHFEMRHGMSIVEAATRSDASSLSARAAFLSELTLSRLQRYHAPQFKDLPDVLALLQRAGGLVAFLHLVALAKRDVAIPVAEGSVQ